MRFRLVFCVAAVLAGCTAQVPTPPPEVPPGQETPVEFAAARAGEKGKGLLVRPAGSGPFPPVVLLPGDYGLDERMRAFARRLAGKGCLVLAVDLFRGEVARDVEEAHILGRALPEDRVAADIRGAVGLLVKHPDVKQGPLAVVGWQLGGGYAIDSAIADPRITAVVTCYGSLPTEAKTLGPMRASVLGIFAGKSEGLPPETIEAFRRAMTKAGKKLAEIYTFQDQGDGFMNPAPGPGAAARADSAAAEEAWKKIDDYLGAELGLGKVP
jgi:carboxymethylenebutenolidase